MFPKQSKPGLYASAHVGYDQVSKDALVVIFQDYPVPASLLWPTTFHFSPDFYTRYYLRAGNMSFTTTKSLEQLSQHLINAEWKLADFKLLV